MYLEQVFTQILKMSMTAGWCILAVLVLHLIFHKAPKKYLYALWLVVAFRLLCPFSISTPVGIFQGEQTTVGQTVSEQTSVEQAAVLRSDNSSKVQPMENSQQISIAGGEQPGNACSGNHPCGRREKSTSAGIPHLGHRYGSSGRLLRIQPLAYSPETEEGCVGRGTESPS